jgi:hypothetical protein
MDTSPPQFDDFAAQRFKGFEGKFLRGIIPEILPRIRPGLQTIGSDDLASGDMFNQKMIANRVKGIGITTGLIGLRQAFIQFHVKYLKAQRLRRVGIIRSSRQTRSVVRGIIDDEPDRFTNLIHTFTLSNVCYKYMAVKLLFPAPGEEPLHVFAQ